MLFSVLAQCLSVQNKIQPLLLCFHPTGCLTDIPRRYSQHADPRWLKTSKKQWLCLYKLLICFPDISRSWFGVCFTHDLLYNNLYTFLYHQKFSLFSPFNHLEIQWVVPYGSLQEYVSKVFGKAATIFSLCCVPSSTWFLNTKCVIMGGRELNITHRQWKWKNLEILVKSWKYMLDIRGLIFLLGGITLEKYLKMFLVLYWLPSKNVKKRENAPFSHLCPSVAVTIWGRPDWVEMPQLFRVLWGSCLTWLQAFWWCCCYMAFRVPDQLWTPVSFPLTSAPQWVWASVPWWILPSHTQGRK